MLRRGGEAAEAGGGGRRGRPEMPRNAEGAGVPGTADVRRHTTDAAKKRRLGREMSVVRFLFRWESQTTRV